MYVVCCGFVFFLLFIKVLPRRSFIKQRVFLCYHPWHHMMLPKTNQESRFWRSACVSPHFIQPHCSSVIIPKLSQSALTKWVAICKRKCLPPWIKATVENFGKADLDTSWEAVWLLRNLEKTLTINVVNRSCAACLGVFEVRLQW